MANDPGWYARHLGTAPAPQAYAPAPEYQVPQASGQQAGKYISPQPQQAPQVTTENLFEMTQYWTGGEAHMKERNPCPQCGGQHYYSRNTGVTRGPPPAPMCFDCGFNGMFQQGDPTTWGATG